MDKQEEQLKDFKHLRENIARIMDISVQTMETLEELPPNQEKALQHASDFVENLKMVRDQFEKKLGRLNTAMPTAPCSTHLDHLEADVQLFEEMLASKDVPEQEEQRPSRQGQHVHFIPAGAEHTTPFPPLRHPPQANVPGAPAATTHGAGSNGTTTQQPGTHAQGTARGVQPTHPAQSSASANGELSNRDTDEHARPVMDLLPDRPDADVAIVPVSSAATGAGGGSSGRGMEQSQQQGQQQQQQGQGQGATTSEQSQPQSQSQQPHPPPPL